MFRIPLRTYLCQKKGGGGGQGAEVDVTTERVTLAFAGLYTFAPPEQVCLGAWVHGCAWRCMHATYHARRWMYTRAALRL